MPVCKQQQTRQKKKRKFTCWVYIINSMQSARVTFKNRRVLSLDRDCYSCYLKVCLRRQTHAGDRLWALRRGQSPPVKVIAALSLSTQAIYSRIVLDFIVIYLWWRILCLISLWYTVVVCEIFYIVFVRLDVCISFRCIFVFYFSPFVEVLRKILIVHLNVDYQLCSGGCPAPPELVFAQYNILNTQNDIPGILSLEVSAA